MLAIPASPVYNSIMEKDHTSIKQNSALLDRALQRTPSLSGHFDPEIRRELEARLFNAIETHSWHNSYDQEQRELAAVASGDIPLLEKSWSEWGMGSIGVMAEDSLRNQKTNAIVVITTSSRAAISGGLPSEISFILSDIYMNRIENATAFAEPMKLARDAEYLYASLVHDIRSRSSCPAVIDNAHIESCKDYVFRHLHEKTVVKDIAEALDINADYLSSLFKKHEGISLSAYILKEKIALAKNLLIYSHYTYSEIANYLGFSSQSHLGDRFKRITSHTLKEFRTKYQMKDFMD